ncbi:MAG: hypothetical protein WAM88_01620 [Nitrososphaeraceae archaeon]|jgi:hypothetical protein
MVRKVLTEQDYKPFRLSMIRTKCVMDLTTNSVVVTDAIKYVQTNKEKLAMSTKEENEKESKEPDYDNGEDKNQLEGNKKRKQKIKK